MDKQQMNDQTVITLPDDLRVFYTRENNSLRWLSIVRELLGTWGEHVAANVREGLEAPAFSDWTGLHDITLTNNQRQVFETWGEKIAADTRQGKKLPTVGSIWGSSVELVGSELKVNMFPALFPEKLVKGRVPRANSPQWTEVYFDHPEDMEHVFDGVNIRYEGDVKNPAKHNVLIGIHGRTGQLMVWTTGGMVTDDITAAEDPFYANSAERLFKEGGMKISEAEEHYLAWHGIDGDMNYMMRRVFFRRSADWVRYCYERREAKNEFTTLLVVPANFLAIQRVCEKYADKLKVFWVIEEIAKLAYGV
ncbi:hypothetical protein MK805_05175 [Shimazuella sp. AN120528]|uniref:hypothetical protein n=1 Tax=Shimazuella soli TaxID=1892854 RepID=UPI001F116122|nr:hypothetical protein [Shimazuella soli]MCH5584361.1 hypothetical protein [Shimazuella soli]